MKNVSHVDAMLIVKEELAQGLIRAAARLQGASMEMAPVLAAAISMLLKDSPQTAGIVRVMLNQDLDS